VDRLVVVNVTPDYVDVLQEGKSVRHQIRLEVADYVDGDAGSIPVPALREGVSPYGTSWHLVALPDRTKFSE
jgi:hypothetical protein